MNIEELAPDAPPPAPPHSSVPIVDTRAYRALRDLERAVQEFGWSGGCAEFRNPANGDDVSEDIYLRVSIPALEVETTSHGTQEVSAGLRITNDVLTSF